MGFQYRKRTKGSKSWLNFSKSGVSLSVKFGDMTVNFGRGKIRSTYNFGDGFRYITSKSWFKKKKVVEPSNKEWKTPEVPVVSEVVLTPEQERQRIMDYVAKHSRPIVKESKVYIVFRKIRNFMFISILVYVLIFAILYSLTRS